MSLAAFVLLGALWRVWDGAGWWRGGYRVAVAAGLVLLACVINFRPEILEDWIALVLASAFVTWALARGYKDWASWENLGQYWPAMTGGTILAFTFIDAAFLLGYALALLAAGAAHPIVTRLNVHTRFAEAAVGGLVIGGLLL